MPSMAAPPSLTALDHPVAAGGVREVGGVVVFAEPPFMFATVMVRMPRL